MKCYFNFIMFVACFLNMNDLHPNSHIFGNLIPKSSIQEDFDDKLLNWTPWCVVVIIVKHLACN
jgi:hypothetical protein